MATAFTRDAIPPCVFQCASCRTLLGDSHAFVGVASIDTSEEEKLVVLQAANEVTVDRIPHSETIEGQDATFFAVCCSGCGSAVGRMFTVVPPGLAHALHRFAFSANKVTSYRLGSAPIISAAASMEDVELADQQQQQHPGSSRGQPEQAEAGSSLALAEKLASLQEQQEIMQAELTKLQMMFMTHHVQLTRLPGFEQAQQDSDLGLLQSSSGGEHRPPQQP